MVWFLPSSIYLAGGGTIPASRQVVNWSALPDPTTVTVKQTWWVENPQGTILLGNKKDSGAWYSTGTEWKRHGSLKELIDWVNTFFQLKSERLSNISNLTIDNDQIIKWDNNTETFVATDMPSGAEFINGSVRFEQVGETPTAPGPGEAIIFANPSGIYVQSNPMPLPLKIHIQKNSFNNGSEPDVNTDQNSGFSESSIYHTAAGGVWYCVSDAVGAAVWLELTGGSGGGFDLRADPPGTDTTDPRGTQVLADDDTAWLCTTAGTDANDAVWKQIYLTPAGIVQSNPEYQFNGSLFTKIQRGNTGGATVYTANNGGYVSLTRNTSNYNGVHFLSDGENPDGPYGNSIKGEDKDFIVVFKFNNSSYANNIIFGMTPANGVPHDSCQNIFLDGIEIGSNTSGRIWRGIHRYGYNNPNSSHYVVGHAPSITAGDWYVLVIRNCVSSTPSLEFVKLTPSLPTHESRGTLLFQGTLPVNEEWALCPDGTLFKPTVWFLWQYLTIDICEWRISNPGIIPSFWNVT